MEEDKKKKEKIFEYSKDDTKNVVELLLHYSVNIDNGLLREPGASPKLFAARRKVVISRDTVHR